MKNYIKISILVVVSIVVSSCAQIQEQFQGAEFNNTTNVAAATGGVIGAGLGAIVGNQTGDAGTGLLVGAVAGTAAGAAVGSALEGQEEAIRTQDEAIERQEINLRAQRAEIEELRRINQDSGSFRSSAYDAPKAAYKRYPYTPRSTSKNDTKRVGTAHRSGVVEKTISTTDSKPVTDKSVPLNKPNLAEVNKYAAANSAVSGTECKEGLAEAGKANAAVESADKLFHLRRALRLCPDNAYFHNSLGEVYLSLNRLSDAEFEFREAVRLDSNFTIARNNLDALGR